MQLEVDMSALTQQERHIPNTSTHVCSLSLPLEVPAKKRVGNSSLPPCGANTRNLPSKVCLWKETRAWRKRRDQCCTLKFLFVDEHLIDNLLLTLFGGGEQLNCCCSLSCRLALCLRLHNIKYSFK